MASTPKPVRKEIKKRMHSDKIKQEEHIRKGIAAKGSLKTMKMDKKRSMARHKTNIRMGKEYA